MEFCTPVVLKPADFTFSYTDQTLLLGSCFAENIGKSMISNKFTIDINPFGILYNPASIALSLQRLLHPVFYQPDDLFSYEGVFHSFEHHSRFSSCSAEEGVAVMNEQLRHSSDYILQANRLIITFGTAYVYKFKKTGRVVANCHKLPENLFLRERLTPDEIVVEWQSVLQTLYTYNPQLKILFTVSPIRHWGDGAHANQLSKATLLLAIDRLLAEFPDQTSYFPAYELVMDELRDYRFYAEDMLHPSSQTIDYIWERFAATHFTQETLDIQKEWGSIRKAIDHKPFQPGSAAYKQFIMQTLLKIERLKEKFPFFDLIKEKEILESKLS
ncbi:GSCFA domain-containing protein [Parabacteroides sp. PF5-9]|uniref:GSCFA domain-containing protein n=1 Tax=Parabacteroides sp. PF5-9 TaxID=1742404 RepID=UPI0024752FE2|nr:GSCFA domain-containing protein [Parabacteroides sp. PF5-9]MDH6356666.1 hypothetical protein [Parabacteroides sp. PF5-9]